MFGICYPFIYFKILSFFSPRPCNESLGDEDCYNKADVEPSSVYDPNLKERRPAQEIGNTQDIKRFKRTIKWPKKCASTKTKPVVDLSNDKLTYEDIVKHGGTPTKSGQKKKDPQPATPSRGRGTKRKADVDDKSEEARKKAKTVIPAKESPSVHKFKKRNEKEDEESKAPADLRKIQKAKEGLKYMIEEMGQSEEMLFSTHPYDSIDLTAPLPESDPAELLGVSEGAFADFEPPRKYNPTAVHRSRWRPKTNEVKNVYSPCKTTDDEKWSEYRSLFMVAKNWGVFRIIQRKLPDLDNIPDQIINCRLNTDFEDLIAKHVLPVTEVPFEFPYAVRCQPDGDCLFNAISRLMYGNQGRAEELRVRMLIEAVQNEEWYLDQDYLLAGLTKWKETDQASQIIRATGVYPTVSTFLEMSPEDRKFWFRKKLFRHTKVGEHCGLFIMHIMSNVCRRPILSVLPSCTDRKNLGDLHRMVWPYRPEDRVREPFVIMWSCTGVDSPNLNHFIPIVE